MNQKEVAIVGKTFLFRETPPEALRALLEGAGAYTEFFSPGEEILFFDANFRRIGIIISGKAAVFSRQEERGALINLLEEGCTFGVLSLYSEEQKSPTRVICRRRAEVLFVDAARCDFFLTEKEIARRLVSFLTERIQFLNQKIAALTAPSAEAGLALFLLENTDESGKYHASAPFAALAQMLGLGRASFYRALNSLEKCGAIRREGKEIAINRMALRARCGFVES